MLTAGVFHKKIDGLVSSQTTNNVSYASTGLAEGLYPGVTGSTNVASYTRSVNLNEATLTGLELSAQSDFFFLPGPFKNMGVVANVTFIDSETTNLVNGKNQKGAIYGMSDLNHNVTLYYETAKWGARISSNYRSDYTIDSGGFKATTYIDAAAFYQLTPSIRLSLDAVNLSERARVPGTTATTTGSARPAPAGCGTTPPAAGRCSSAPTCSSRRPDTANGGCGRIPRSLFN
jgi:iron complex outermembrane receptor protein